MVHGRINHEQSSRSTPPAATVRAQARGESGQSLVLVVIAMTLIVALAAFAIDVGEWYVSRHQAQVVADSAALAAANCLATTRCTQTTTDGDAVHAADQTVDGGVEITNVTFGNYKVTVTTKKSSSAGFERLFGIGSTNASATATASYDRGTGLKWSCSSDCVSLFAGNDTCPESTVTNMGLSLVINDHGGGNEDISGLFTNGYYYNGAASGSYAATEVSPACGSDEEKKSDHTSFSTVGAPVNYPAVWTLPACTNTGASWTTADITGGGVYCVSSTPAQGACTSDYTGAGAINVDLSALPAGSYEFVGPCVVMSGSQKSDVTNIAGQPLVYGTSNTARDATSDALPSCTLNDGSNGTSTWLTGNNATLDDMVYDQCGTFEVTGNSVTIKGFVEAWNIITNKNGSVIGTGPASVTNPQVTTLAGTDWLSS